MSCSDRTRFLAEKSLIKGKNQPVSTFEYDYHSYAKTRYAQLEKWEKIARSMADAVVNQEVYIEPYDNIIGRVFYANRKKVEFPDPELDYNSAPYRRLCKEIPDYEELRNNGLTGTTALGHITWAWDSILRSGTSGMKKQYEQARQLARDEKSRQFYSGVLIMLEALENWNDKHVTELKKLGMTDLADLCAYVPKNPARNFREAVQSFYMQYIVVMGENPFGGNGPGRLDYYLWPYLEKDYAEGKITAGEVRELIDELFLRMDERIHDFDMWVEAVSVGGSHPNGTSAVNPLSYIMIESIMDLNITHPSVYVRLPKNPPQDFVKLCAKYLKSGSNRAQLLSDESIIGAMTKTGVPYCDAVEYACGGCMEIGLQGMTSDFLYNGWQNLTKIAELCTTGGVCLKTGKRLASIRASGLEKARDFEEFYQSFIKETERILNIFFYAQDVYSEEAARTRPSYLISAMIRDCYAKGRNMHDGGARYHDYGSTPIGLPNTSDYLFAIKKAVFDDGICTKAELLQALRANFEGYEALRLRLRNIPKYGQENEEADRMFARLMADVSRIYTSYRNRFGGMGKLVILTFIWAPEAGAMLGATADGNFAGKPVAHGVTPQSSSMSKGITAAMNSCAATPFELVNGGASTMWDLDPAWATEEIIEALFTTFFENGGQIYQGNMTDVESLIKAQKNPEEYGNLIVRVGGYSARFVNLNRALQDDVISRLRHAR